MLLNSTVVPLRKDTDATLEPGVKPAPAIPTVEYPDMPCVAARVMLGVASIVSVAVAVLPDASVTVMVKVPGAVVAGINTADADGTSPTVSDVTVVVFSVVPVLNHVVGLPFKDTVSAEDAANTAPLIGTVAGALTAVNRFVFRVVLSVIVGRTVNVAVAAALLAVTVIMCAPATVKVLGMVVV